MTPPGLRHGLATALLALAATAPPLPAQQRVETAVSAGASLVRYDGFLPSGAASLTPSLRVSGPAGTLDASLASLFFQSGHASLTAAIDGAYALPQSPVGRLALTASAGASDYQRDYRYAHLLAGGRLSAEPAAGRLALWADGRAGGSWRRELADPRTDTLPADSTRATAAHQSAGAAALQASGGLTLQLRRASVTGALQGERVGDARLADATLTLAWLAGPLRLDGQLGVRRAHADPVRGFADAALTYRLTRTLALSARGGRYAGDPILGTIAGRFAELSARVLVGVRAPAASVPARVPIVTTLARLGVEVRGASGGARELRLRVPGAERVEIMADFTGWEPVSLRADADEHWSLTTAVPPGLHRVNVRIDGGAWTVPPGLTAVADEFGGTVGILVVD